MNESKLSQIRHALQEELPTLRRNFGVATLGIFGSYRRGEEHGNSDLDLLVTFEETPSLLRLIEVENYLSDQLNVPVDLVLEQNLKPGIGERVRSEVMPI